MKIKFQSVILIIAIILIPCLHANGQINENYMENWDKAYKAKSDIECQASLKFCNEVLKVVPNHPILNYQAVRLNALLVIMRPGGLLLQQIQYMRGIGDFILIKMK